jgi:hypothetical protein
MTVATSPTSGGVKLDQALLKRIPLATFGETAALAKLSQLGINYTTDIHPLFGNPVVLGLAADGTGTQAGKQFLLVWTTANADALHALVKKLLPTASSSGTRDGATLYNIGSLQFALAGPTVVLGSSTAVVETALDRHAHTQGITPSDYASDTAGLPKGAAVQAFGSLVGVLSRPSAATARHVPWVAALRGYSMAVTAGASGLTFKYRLDTAGASLSSAQLPIASGTAPPSLPQPQFPIMFGLRAPAQVAAFVESAQQASSRAQYQKFETRQAKLRSKTGVDLNSLLSLLTGSLIIGSDTKTTVGRVTVTSPAQASRILSKLVGDPRDVFPRARGVTRTGQGFYTIKERAQAITVGVVGNQLVAGKATPAELTAFASAPTTPATGAQGSVAFRIALPALLHLAVKHPSKIEQTVLSVLGDVTGWSAASPSGLTGSATLALG